MTLGHKCPLISRWSLRSLLFEQPNNLAGLRRQCFLLPERVKFTSVVPNMRFKVPGQSVSVRLFERVATVDNQYDIFDVGIEQEDGSVDSVVVGGSFSYAKSLVRKADEQAEANKAKATSTPVVTVVAEAAA